MNPREFIFEKLEVWKLARLLAKEVYKITRRFPGGERFGLVSQITRSSISVCCNIAEGSARASPGDQAHFTTMAYSSLMELFNLLIIASDEDLLRESELGIFRDRIRNLSVKLSNLKTSQLNRIDKQRKSGKF